MTPLPPPLGTGELVAWRLHRTRYRDEWDSGEGAFRWGGRWNSRGVRAVYCSLDPATAILEVAVHTGFAALDAVPHTLTAITITDLTQVHVVDPADVPDPGWLVGPSNPTAAQQAFGDALLATHALIAIPSTVSTHSWNLIFPPTDGAGYAARRQEDFVLDPRLHPMPH